MIAAAISLTLIAFPTKAAAVSSNEVKIFITTDGSGIKLKKADGYIPAVFTVYDVDGEIRTSSGQIKVRGNSTADRKKNPYTIKFDNKMSIGGIEKAKKWALLANLFDPTLVRNSIAFDIAKELNIPFTPDSVYSEVWLDGNYLGCYLLTDPVQVNSGRVEIDTDNGDFLIEFEGTREEEGEIYLVSEGLRFVLSDPEDPDPAVVTEIQNKLDSVLHSVRYGSWDEVCEKIDVTSFAEYYLLNEYYKTVDFGYSSAFFNYSSGKLYAGPAWDYDLSSGNVNIDHPKHAQAYSRAADTSFTYADSCNIFRYLCVFDEFYEEVRKVYSEHYDFFKEIPLDGGLVDRTISDHSEIFTKNYTDTKISIAKSYCTLMRAPDDTYEENVAYYKNWLNQRNEFLSVYYQLFEDNLKGDLNYDGDLDMNDLVIMQSYLLRKVHFDKHTWNIADINEDGKANVFDLIAMRQMIVG